ncbi:hypothetical protein F2Q69_00013238 [Brassica cretica]|uniref:Uncharacterized protein n=1 Tax=Brassica cretica TaxID=69181 RepID=A0A8S9QWG4_BRACR|nr:hypothetical protein F2Q69_00013238 [Brassica cretica]
MLSSPSMLFFSSKLETTSRRKQFGIRGEASSHLHLLRRIRRPSRRESPEPDENAGLSSSRILILVSSVEACNISKLHQWQLRDEFGSVLDL